MTSSPSLFSSDRNSHHRHLHQQPQSYILIIYSEEYTSVVFKTLNNISVSFNSLQKKKVDRLKFDRLQVYLHLQTEKKKTANGWK